MTEKKATKARQEQPKSEALSPIDVALVDRLVVKAEECETDDMVSTRGPLKWGILSFD